MNQEFRSCSVLAELPRSNRDIDQADENFSYQDENALSPEE